MSKQLMEEVLRSVTEIVDNDDFEWTRQDLNANRDPKASGFAGVSSQGDWRIVVARFTPHRWPRDVGYDGAAVCLDGVHFGTVLHLTPELAEKCWLQADKTTSKKS
jgi:hypothetical protein